MSKTQYYALIFTTALAPISWGTTYVVTSELLPPDRPLTTAVLRVLPAGLLLLLWSFARLNQQQLLRLLLLSALNVGGFQALLFIAAYRLPGGVAAVLASLQPLVLLLIVWCAERKPPMLSALLACLGAVVGMVLLLWQPQQALDAVGVIAALASAAVMATGLYLTARWKSTLPLLPFTGWQLLFGGLMLLPAAWWFEGALPRLQGSELIAYGYLSLVGSLLAYLLWFRGLRQLPPLVVVPLGLLSPITAVLIGACWLQQSFNALAWCGLALALFSAWWLQHSSAQGRVERAQG